MFKLLRKFLTDQNFLQKKEFLRSLELFKEIRDKDLGHLVSALHSRVYKEGEVVFLEGDVGRALFILESGRVELTKKENGGKPKRIFTLEQGDFFGEMALLEQLPRTASAIAVDRAYVHLLYKAKLETLLHYHPRIGVIIMTHLAQLMSARLRHTTKLATLQDPPTYG